MTEAETIPPADAAATLAALDEIGTHPEVMQELKKKTEYFRRKLLDLGFDLGNSNSAIVPVYILNFETLLQFPRDLYLEGIFSVSVAFPAVKIDEGRCRFTVNQSHTFAQIETTVSVLEKLGKQHGLIHNRAGVEK